MAIPLAAAAVGSHAMNKSAPPPPNYQGAARQQAQASQVNMAGPYSSQQWQQGPRDPNSKDAAGPMTLTNTLSGPLAEASSNAQHQAATQGALPTGMEARQQSIDSYMDAAQSRLDPMFQQREAALRTQLLNQGLDPSSEASLQAMREFGHQRNDAYGGAMANAVAQGNAAGSSIFQQGLQSQQMPYQQMAMLQGLTNPGFGAAAGMYQTPQHLAAAGMQGGYDLARWQQQNQNTADAFGGATDVIMGPTNLLAGLFGGG